VALRLRYYTDPACPASWAAEPARRRLSTEFGADLSITYVMGGLAREYEAPHEARLSQWLDWADRSGMPFDPRLWSEGPLRSSYPACMAVKAAAEQGPGAAERYLRALREGIFCFRRRLDAAEALVEEARGVRLDVTRFRSDLESHAIVEAFGADLEETRTVPPEARERGGVAEAGPAGGERLVFPTLRFDGEDGTHWVFGEAPYEEWRAAAVAAGGEPSGDAAPDVPGALRRFGRMADLEVEAVCDLPGPRANAELWRLASEWRVRPVRVLTGTLWEAA
jgi:predicted DsbA family dithiol-disulfide isomerase